MGTEQLLTVEDVATMLRKHPQTIRAMARQRKIPAIKFGGRTSPYRFRPSSIEAWIAKQERQGTS